MYSSLMTQLAAISLALAASHPCLAHPQLAPAYRSAQAARGEEQVRQALGLRGAPRSLLPH